MAIAHFIFNAIERMNSWQEKFLIKTKKKKTKSKGNYNKIKLDDAISDLFG